MKRTVLLMLIVTLLLTAATGCRTIFGRGRGPVESVVFLPQHNPGLAVVVSGAINERREPKEVMVVVPPGTDPRQLVATISLNTPATVRVISSGEPVVQQNSVTSNDFSIPVLYSIVIPGDSEPWLYRVTVREADTNARLSTLQIADVAGFSPQFNPGVHEYTAEVLYSSRSLRFDVRAQSQFLQRIIVDGSVVRGGSGGVNVAFDGVDVKEVYIEAIAEDGVTQEVYRVTLFRAPPDGNPALAAVTVSGGSLNPSFDPNRLHYVTEVPYESTEVVVTVRPQSRFATASVEAGTQGVAISVSGDPASQQGARVAFIDTDRLILAIAVRAEDGTPLRYTLDVRRAAPTVAAPAPAPTPAAPTPTPAPAPAPQPAPSVTQPTPAPAPTPQPAPPVTQPTPAPTPQPAPPVTQPTPAPAPTPQPAPSVTQPTPAPAPTPQPAPSVTQPTPAPAPTPVGRAVVARINVVARSLSVDRAVSAALTAAREEIRGEGVVTVREYHGEGVFFSRQMPVSVQRRGNNPPVVSFDWTTDSLSVAADSMVEIEVAIPTSGGRFLHYNEVVTASGNVGVVVPFLRLSDTPRVQWPRVGTLVPVTGYFSMIPPGQIARAEVEELPRSLGTPQGAVLAIRDGGTDSQLFRDTVWSGGGIRAGQQISFDREVVVDEGRSVSYTLEVRSADGRGWRRSGRTVVRTTQIAPAGGFAPAVLFVFD